MGQPEPDQGLKVDGQHSNRGFYSKDEPLKILVVGDVGVGKTALIRRYVHGQFSHNYKATVGVDFALKVLPWDERTNVRLQIWDIAGQERFGRMTRVYYQGAVGAFLVYDVTRPNTFETVKKWKADMDEKVYLHDGSHISVFLLANKKDLQEQSEVSESWEAEMNTYCKENGFAGWFSTSAKDGTGIHEAGKALVAEIFNRDHGTPEHHLAEHPAAVH